MPDRIDAYRFGRIEVDGTAYQADLILFPDRIQTDWWRRKGHFLQVEDLAGLEREAPDALVIGTGAHGAMAVSPEVEAWLDGLGIAWEKLPTRAACERYNALRDQDRRVVAALHLTC